MSDIPGIAVMHRNRETGEAVKRILGLPNDAWTDVSIQFSTDDIATATVTFLLTTDQVKDLAGVLTGVPAGGRDG